MTIIQVNKFFYKKGGAEQYMLDLFEWLQATGHEVIPFAMQHPNNLPTPYAVFFPSYVETAKVTFGWQGVRTLGRMVYSFAAKRRMARLVEAKQPKLAHIHNIYAQLSPSVLVALKEQGVPMVMTVHDHALVSPEYNRSAHPNAKDVAHMGVWAAARTRFHKGSYMASLVQRGVFGLHRWLKIYANTIDVFIVPSKYLQGRLLLAGYDPSRMVHIPHGIDVSGPMPTIGHDGYVLFVGRLSEEKGVHMVLEMARALTHIPFVIVGTGPEESALHLAADGLSHVRFVGFQTGEDLAKWYAGAMCVVVPSTVHENFPLTILEAMKYGKPVIGSKVGGIPEMVSDGTTGYVVDPFHVPGWIEAVERIASDAPRWQSMAHAAFRRVKEEFSLEAHHAQLECVYAKLISRTRAK